MNLVAFMPLILFLLATTLFIAMISPAYAIFPVFVLFLVGTALFFRPWGSPTAKKKVPRAPQKPPSRKPSFDGPFSPKAYSRLSLIDHMSREKEANQNPTRADAEIGAEVRALLASDPGLRAVGIEAESRFGRVTLTGRAPDEAHRDRARTLAASVPGVVDVSMQIRLPSRGKTA